MAYGGICPCMRKALTGIPALFLVLGLAACGDGQPEDARVYGAASAPALPGAEETAAPPQHVQADGGPGLAAMLAYEHSASIQIAAELIPQRQQAVQAACRDVRFGDCVVLNVQEQGGDRPSASVTVRIVPEGVEPMIALAGDGARLGSRSTRAEDLAAAVRDNSQAQDRLRREMERLQQFQQRSDLAVADMIALSERMAAVEAGMEDAAQLEAQYRRRIDTQLLSFNFRPPGGQAGRNQVGLALRDIGTTLTLGTAWTIRAVAFLAPLVVVLAVLVAVIRRIRRRRRA